MTDFAPNVLIEASAGTGKTQALAERLIALLRRKVRPQDIVALTFSRAAAGEIFERFVTLLAERAADDAADAALLREVIATQHLSQIGTLDSFLMRIVRAFPLELGLRGELEMMDDYRAGAERAGVSFAVLRQTDPAVRRAFLDAFDLALDHEDVRSFVESYQKFVATWHERVLAAPTAEAWGDPAAIWGTAPAFASVTECELAAAARGLEGLENSKPWAEFVAWVRDFRGIFTGVKGIAKKLLESDPMTGATVEFDFGTGKDKHRAFLGEAAAAVRQALLCVAGYVVRQRLERARGVYNLVSAFERVYDRRVRRTGKLVFADIPRLIAALDASMRLALEYRLDAKLGAWALDEFQDTSREQWKALANLLDEAKQSDGEKSVFIVGDRKQAIYGWRNGDVTIFTRERESGAYQCGELQKTWRSGPAVVEAVNRIFAYGPVTANFPAWSSPEHVSARPELAGFVQTVTADGPKADDFIAPVEHALKAVDPVRRGLSAAVLVRSNAFGERLADALKARGVEGVVWEGESAILDTPALTPFLDLVQLADHPGDTMAYRHFALSPLAAARYPDGLPPAAEISREMALAFTTQGIVRVFRALRALLPADPSAAWSVFTEERFTDMLRAAAKFELAMKPDTRLADFPRFLQSVRKRNLAEPGRIKVMTIHRSKGLGFDYVVVPLYESSGLSAEPDGPLVGDAWVLPDPGPRVARLVGGLDAARRLRNDRAEQEALCTYYVALTRAKRAMTLVLQPPTKTETASVRFSDLVRQALPTEIGTRTWAQDFVRPPDTQPAESVPRAVPERAAREKVRRRLPSQLFHDGQSAGSLFDSVDIRSAATQRGTDVHAEFARIEWAGPAQPPALLADRLGSSAWRAAFVRPSADATVWRERAYERMANGVWESGQFDRVVFTGAGDARRAVIYDFKTNRRLRDETEDAFAVRLKTAYAGQLAAYRTALAALTGIPLERIETVLLSTELKEGIAV